MSEEPEKNEQIVGDPMAGLVLSTLQENETLTKRLNLVKSAHRHRPFINITPEFLARLEANMIGMRAIVRGAMQENRSLLDAIEALGEAIKDLTLKIDQLEGKA